MSKKTAIINIKLNLMQLNISRYKKDIMNFYDKINLDQLDYKIINYIKGAIKQLYEKKIINDESEIINYVSNIYPVQLTHSTNCSINILKLKQLQNCLLKNKFKIKIIV